MWMSCGCQKFREEERRRTWLTDTHPPRHSSPRALFLKLHIEYYLTFSHFLKFHHLGFYCNARRVKKKLTTLWHRSFTFSLDECKAKMLQFASVSLLFHHTTYSFAMDRIIKLYQTFNLVSDFRSLDNSCELKEIHLLRNNNIAYCVMGLRFFTGTW